MKVPSVGRGHLEAPAGDAIAPAKSSNKTLQRLVKSARSPRSAREDTRAARLKGGALELPRAVIQLPEEVEAFQSRWVTRNRRDETAVAPSSTSAETGDAAPPPPSSPAADGPCAGKG